MTARPPSSLAMAAYVQAHLAEKAMLQRATARIAAQQVRAPAATVRLLPFRSLDGKRQCFPGECCGKLQNASHGWTNGLLPRRHGKLAPGDGRAPSPGGGRMGGGAPTGYHAGARVSHTRNVWHSVRSTVLARAMLTLAWPRPSPPQRRRRRRRRTCSRPRSTPRRCPVRCPSVPCSAMWQVSLTRRAWQTSRPMRRRRRCRRRRRWRPPRRRRRRPPRPSMRG